MVNVENGYGSMSSCEKEVRETEVRLDFYICEAEVLRGHKGEVHFLDQIISLSYGNNS